MLVPQLIFDTLQDLREEDFKTFKWFLTSNPPDSYQRIPVSRVENAGRHDLVSKMIESYGEEKTVLITEDILKRMQQNNPAQKLRSAYTEATKAASSTTSSTVTPPAAASVSAQHGSVVIAPTLSSGTTGSWNITINK